MNETNQFMRHILAVKSTESVLDLSPTIDPEIRGIIRDGFFLSVVVLLFLYILKLIYVSMVLFNVMTASEDSQVENYPGGCNLCCDIIGSLLMLITISIGIYSIYAPDISLILGIIYLSSIGGSLANDFITLISVCNTENHSEYTLSYGLISMAIVICESLSLNISAFHIYHTFMEWKEENRDKNIELWPFT